MKTVASFALGCKVNHYESEAIGELFKNKGYEVVDIDSSADIYIINTCTVTNFGDKKSRQLIRKVKRQNPNSFVAVIGCYAQTDPGAISSIEGVNLVLGTKGKKDIVDIVEEAIGGKDKRVFVSEITEERIFESLNVSGDRDMTRAYVKIEDGCDRFCSYCIIPYARGPVRSRNIEHILEEVKTLSENGFKEIVLTGIHVASYGKDLGGLGLIDVIERASLTENIERIRLSSVEPGIITEEFMERLSRIPKVCNHFHLSLQSGCEKTLKDMNRRYTPKEYLKAVELIRDYMPESALTTDVIVGFPGESDNDFSESLEFVEKIGFLKVHVFPYSKKAGTAAAKRKDQIRNSVKAERSKRMLNLSEGMGNRFLSRFLGKKLPVLFEQKTSDGSYIGHTTNYIPVSVISDTDIVNEIRSVKITDIKKDSAKGVLITRR